MWLCVCMYVCACGKSEEASRTSWRQVRVAVVVCAIYTAILITIEGQFRIFQRFSSSKLVLKTVESCFDALDYYENGSST
jgi:hypothetical protein